MRPHYASTIISQPLARQVNSAILRCGEIECIRLGRHPSDALGEVNQNEDANQKLVLAHWDKVLSIAFASDFAPDLLGPSKQGDEADGDGLP